MFKNNMKLNYFKYKNNTSEIIRNVALVKYVLPNIYVKKDFFKVLKLGGFKFTWLYRVTEK